MSGKILRKIYCRITFTLASPLAVGSGTNESSDRDIVRDAKGEPYIPASAIAGVCRSFFPRKGKGADVTRKCFGDVMIHRSADEKKTENKIESALIFYDARILTGEGGQYYTSIRNSVALDQYKNSLAGARFDMEVLEPGIRFRTYLEQNVPQPEPSKDVHGNEICRTDGGNYVQEIVDILQSGRAYFGARSMRGYGAIRDVKAEVLEFELGEGNQEAIRRWIAFDMYDEAAWKKAVPCKAGIMGEADRKLTLSLSLRGGISIRNYTTETQKDNKAVPDFTQMTVRVFEAFSGNSEEIPVIPGTSWAGAIRHRMRELGLKEEEEKRLFGYVKGAGAREKARSIIRFGESQLTDGTYKEISRNAIDRFSGGTVDGALFTERTYYGGKTKLVISFANGATVDEWTRTHLAAALADLHYGFLAVGGETSIGRGLFRITAVNEQKISSKDTVFDMLDQALEACLSEGGKEA